MIFDWASGLFSNDLAIDLGTATTLIYVKGKGIVSCEPSVVAVSRDGRGGKRVLAVGREAKEMLGRTPGNIQAVRPLRDGVIADFEITETMLRYFIDKATTRRTLVKPRIIICVPFGITEVEKRAVKESAEGAGAREVLATEKDMALALIDVVMETEHSGLELVHFIREELCNRAIRLVLRTGQLGQASEHQIMRDHEIDGYQLKTELTKDKLAAIIISNLRTSAHTAQLVKTATVGL